MIGLGVLSFIAANWNALGRIVKMVMIMGLYAASVGAAWYFERKGRKTASGLLLFLSGFLLLGGLALMSQVFHISGSIDGLLLTWLIAYLPTFLIVRNLAVYLLYEIVTLFYINIVFVDYSGLVKYGRSYNDGASGIYAGPFWPKALIILLVAVAWRHWNDRRRAWDERKKLSPASSEPWARYFFIGGWTRRIFFSNFLILNWFTWMCVINGRYDVIWPYILAMLASGACILFIAKCLDAADLEWQGLLILAAAGMSLTFGFAWDNFDYFEFASDYHLTIFASVLLGAYLVSRIIRRRRGGGFATFLFCALLARWYFDLFYTFMDTAVFFISGGVLLLLVAFAYRKWHKLGWQTQYMDSEGGGDEKTA
jgi:hypothetical protein